MLRHKRKLNILYHIGIWSVLFSCIILWRSRSHMVKEGLTNWEVLLTGIPYIALYYLHAYWMVPSFLFRGKRRTYILLVLAALLSVIALSGLIPFVRGVPPARVPYSQSVLRRAFPGLFFLMAGASIAAIRENFRLEKERKEKETEHLRTELSLLRAQVNPHFMLNVLNSMALLARRKSDLLEPVLMELAGLMNYMLYETDREKIALEDEIRYLKSYIDLQLLRFGDDVRVKFNAPEPAVKRCIEPMLLIPLVENAFKHGIGLIAEPVILIDIRIEEGDRLCLTVRNWYNRSIREGRSPGIGLRNLRKRLELIYPGNFLLQEEDDYGLDAKATEGWYIITLNIPLQ